MFTINAEMANPLVQTRLLQNHSLSTHDPTVTLYIHAITYREVGGSR